MFLAAYFIARAIGGKGKPVLSEPYCAKCGYDLRVNWDSSMVCPECGADLKAKNAVNFGKQTGKTSPIKTLLIVVVILFLLMMFLGAITIPIGRMTTTSSPTAMARMSTAQLITELPKHMQEPWAWNELEIRHTQGKLTTAELDQAFAALTQYLKTLPADQRGPIHYYGDFIGQCLVNGSVSGKEAGAFLTTYFTPVAIINRQRSLDQKHFAAFRIDPAHPWSLGNQSNLKGQTELVKVTCEPDVDTPLIIANQATLKAKIYDNIEPVMIKTRNGWPIFYIETTQLKAGTYELKLNFTTRYFPQSNANSQPDTDQQPVGASYHTVMLKITVDASGEVDCVPVDISRLP
jgi:hypothetical protein